MIRWLTAAAAAQRPLIDRRLEAVVRLRDVAVLVRATGSAGRRLPAVMPEHPAVKAFLKPLHHVLDRFDVHRPGPAIRQRPAAAAPPAVSSRFASLRSQQILVGERVCLKHKSKDRLTDNQLAVHFMSIV